MPQFIANTSQEAKPPADPLIRTAMRGPDHKTETHPAEIAQLREELEKEQQEWEAEAERQAEALAVQVRQVQEKEKQLQAERAEFEQLKAKHTASDSDNLEAVRAELIKLRDALYQQYRQRRDALVAMREAIRRATYKIQEQKRDLQQDQSRHASALEQFRHEQAALDERQNEIAKQAKLLEEWQRELNNDQGALAGKTEALALAQQDLETKTRELHADLVRLQRQREAIEVKQRDLDQRETVISEQDKLIQQERPKLAADRSQLEQQERDLRIRETWQVEKGKELAKHAAELLKQKEAVQKEAHTLQERTDRLVKWEQQLGIDRLRLDRLESTLAAGHEQLKLNQQRQHEEEASWQNRQQKFEQEVIRLKQEIEKQQQLLGERQAREESLAKQNEIEKKQQETQEQAAHPADEELYESPQILPLKSTRADTDQQLADLLSGLGLIDALTLQTLLDEARQQRMTLRDCLLANESLTPYQMELIEAGRLEALVLNSLRIIDRVRTGSIETIYRVFDTRLGDEAILRHLSNHVDPKWQEEYRALFQQAVLIHHPNVARTLEVLEMSGSPAVVQEWLVGLPGTEWAGLVSEPRIAIKLIRQAAAGLAAVHEAGLIHGQLQLGRLLLSAEGALKLCGAGEPKWLAGLASTTEYSMADDVVQLMALILPWCRSKIRHQANTAMAGFVKRLEAKEFSSAAGLEKAIDTLQQNIEPDEGPWQQFLEFIQDRLTLPDSPMPQKKSA